MTYLPSEAGPGNKSRSPFRQQQAKVPLGDARHVHIDQSLNECRTPEVKDPRGATLTLDPEGCW